MNKNLLFALPLLLVSACVTQQNGAEEVVYYIDGKPATLQQVAEWQRSNQQSGSAGAPKTLSEDTNAEPLNRAALKKAEQDMVSAKDIEGIKGKPIRPASAEQVAVYPSKPLNLVPVPESVRKKKFKKPTPKETIVQARKRGELQPAGQNFSGSTLINTYSPDKVDVVYTSPYALTEIILQEGETYLDNMMMDGDPLNWKIEDQKGFGTGNGIRQVIGIKPTLAGLENHIAIYTDRRRYRLKVISKEDAYMPAIQWEYPEDKLAALREKQRLLKEAAAKKERTFVNVGKDYNFNYSIKLLDGPQPPWQPKAVFDNGQKTFIVFSNDIENYEAPALFGRNERGDITILNYRPRGNTWEIDHLIQTAELRFGMEDQTVVQISKEF